MMDFTWYLFKSNMDIEVAGGISQPKNKESALSLSSLESAVRRSDKFYLVSERAVPDGGVLSLYRQR
jgi:hypothetical protein